ncbi:hypothetical protein RF55_24886 [Lasius niger]|uniref:DNA-directed DNA polymerase n=1 Tax=Lasius niger TaxID=67767 RepID=A0A0J7JUE1_LASNI|nr:hypothetical protein RF55_24886 [Lasius niger]
MYDFHYTHMKPKYGSNVRLLFTDTDSLCYEVVTEDIYADMGQDQHLYDFSDYQTTHPLFSNTNKKILGKFKDELSGSIAEEFVGLKPKMYSLKSGSIEKKTAKGVSKLIVKRQIRHDDYIKCLFQPHRELKHGQRIASHCHKLQTLAYGKATLCPIDTKRYLLDDGITSLAYGHHEI